MGTASMASDQTSDLHWLEFQSSGLLAPQHLSYKSNLLAESQNTWIGSNFQLDNNQDQRCKYQNNVVSSKQDVTSCNQFQLSELNWKLVS